MPSLNFKTRTLLSLGLLLPALAQAADPVTSPAARVETIAPPAYEDGPNQDPARTLPPSAGDAGTASSVINERSVPQPSQQVAGMGSSISLQELDQNRGGSSVNTIRSEAVSNGLLQDATASNVATGNNSIADGAFSHAIGLPIVIQNSGANVVIQNSSIVNVQFR